MGVQEIAERSGVTKPTLYYYFKSKYGLLEQLLKSRSEGFAAELKEACAYRGDLKNTLCAAARTAASFVAREPEFSALFVALYHSARGNDAYKAVLPLVLRLKQAIEQIFIDASADLGNMHGRQRQFSLGFIGLVLYYIVMKQETSKREDVQITEEEIEALVHQFMHGIYS